MPITLYHVTWCPECAVVREKLETLGLPYESVLVPDFRPLRKQVHEVSGQHYVPVLKDGETVLTDTHEILAHLEAQYKSSNQESAPPSTVSDSGPLKADG